MEYVFLLPAILSLSPLVSAMRHAQTSEVPIYAFRLYVLSYLLMLTSVILFFGRPSMRRQRAWVVNVLSSSLFGMIALAPVVLFGAAMSNVTTVDYELFSEVELTAAWVGLTITMASNIALLIYIVRKQLLPTCVRWASGSVLVHGVLVFGLLRFW